MAPPKGMTKMEKKWPNLQHVALLKKKFPGGMLTPRICPIFMALAAAGPLRCEHLEPPVVMIIVILYMSD